MASTRKVPFKSRTSQKRLGGTVLDRWDAVEDSLQACVDLDAQGFAVELFDDMEGYDVPPYHSASVTKSQLHHLVGLTCRVQGLFDARRQPLLARWAGQSLLVVHPARAPSCTRAALMAGAVVQQPKAVARAIWYAVRSYAVFCVFRGPETG